MTERNLMNSSKISSPHWRRDGVRTLDYLYIMKKNHFVGSFSRGRLSYSTGHSGLDRLLLFIQPNLGLVACWNWTTNVLHDRWIWTKYNYILIYFLLFTQIYIFVYIYTHTRYKNDFQNLMHIHICVCMHIYINVCFLFYLTVFTANLNEKH